MSEYWKGGIEKKGPRGDQRKMAQMSQGRWRQPLDNNYRASFTMPFSKEDLFREITNINKPLGLDLGKVKFNVSDGWNTRTPATELKIGSIREARFMEGGVIISELVELEAPHRIVWEEIESTVKKVRMVGNGATKPTFGVEFMDQGADTLITLTYNFHRVETPGACCGTSRSKSFPASITNNLADTLKKVWSVDMAARGVTGGGGGGGGGGGSSVAVSSASKLGGGFDVSFKLPFRRQDVYTELVKFDAPLAADKDVKYTLMPGGAFPQTVSLGVRRKAEFTRSDFSGYTVSECIALEEGRVVGWRQLESKKKGMNLLGKNGQMPEFKITLSDTTDGTEVALSYDFASVEGGSVDTLKNFFATSAKGVWQDGMQRRGYRALNPGEITPAPAPVGGAAVEISQAAADAATKISRNAVASALAMAKQDAALSAAPAAATVAANAMEKAKQGAAQDIANAANAPAPAATPAWQGENNASTPPPWQGGNNASNAATPPWQAGSAASTPAWQANSGGSDALQPWQRPAESSTPPPWQAQNGMAGGYGGGGGGFNGFNNFNQPPPPKKRGWFGRKSTKRLPQSDPYGQQWGSQQNLGQQQWGSQQNLGQQQWGPPGQGGSPGGYQGGYQGGSPGFNQGGYQGGPPPGFNQAGYQGGPPAWQNNPNSA